MACALKLAMLAHTESPIRERTALSTKHVASAFLVQMQDRQGNTQRVLDDMQEVHIPPYDLQDVVILREDGPRSSPGPRPPPAPCHPLTDTDINTEARGACPAETK